MTVAPETTPCAVCGRDVTGREGDPKIIAAAGDEPIVVLCMQCAQQEGVGIRNVRPWLSLDY